MYFLCASKLSAIQSFVAKATKRRHNVALDSSKRGSAAWKGRTHGKYHMRIARPWLRTMNHIFIEGRAEKLQIRNSRAGLGAHKKRCAVWASCVVCFTSKEFWLTRQKCRKSDPGVGRKAALAAVPMFSSTQDVDVGDQEDPIEITALCVLSFAYQCDVRKHSMKICFSWTWGS